MLRKLTLFLGFLLLMSLQIISEVGAAASCNGLSTIALRNGRSGSVNLNSLQCYEVTNIPSNTTTLSVRVSVTNGSLDAYWASGTTSTPASKLNPRSITRGARYALRPTGAGSYTLAFMPTVQSSYSISVSALTPPTNTSPPPRPCSTENGVTTCSTSSELRTEDPDSAVLTAYAGDEVSYPFEAHCRSRLDVTVNWTGYASTLRVSLEDEASTFSTAQGSSPLHLFYDIQPEDLSNGPEWDWQVTNVDGGSVNSLDVAIGYADDQACSFDPYQIYGDTACIYGYVWREASSDDRVCVGGDVRAQAASDNSQAASRVDPNGAYGPLSCVEGYVWREAFPGDYVCVTGDVRDQTAFDNSQAARRRDTSDFTPIIITPPVILLDPPLTTSSVDPSAAPTLVPDLASCPNTLPFRMIINQRGRVTPGDPNRIRSASSTSAAMVGQIPPGGEFLVLGGPECNDGYTWWYINYNGVIGWTVEGSSDTYWLEPIGG